MPVWMAESIMLLLWKAVKFSFLLFDAFEGWTRE